MGGDSNEAQACVEAGADAVLRKPVSVSGVARAVATAISMRQIALPEPAARVRA